MAAGQGAGRQLHQQRWQRRGLSFCVASTAAAAVHGQAGLAGGGHTSEALHAAFTHSWAGHSLQSCVGEGGVGGLDGGQGGLVLQTRGGREQQSISHYHAWRDPAGASTVKTKGQPSHSAIVKPLGIARQPQLQLLTLAARADRLSPDSSCVTRHLHNKTEQNSNEIKGRAG